MNQNFHFKKHTYNKYSYLSAFSCTDPQSGRTIRVGDRVRIKSSVTQPRYKWGSVTHRHIGTVTSIAANGRDATIDFATHAHWTGLLSELEVVPSTHTNIQ